MGVVTGALKTGKKASGPTKSIMRAVAQRKRMEQLKRAKELMLAKDQLDIANPDPRTINIPVESEAGALFAHHFPDTQDRSTAGRIRANEIKQKMIGSDTGGLMPAEMLGMTAQADAPGQTFGTFRNSLGEEQYNPMTNYSVAGDILDANLASEMSRMLMKQDGVAPIKLRPGPFKGNEGYPVFVERKGASKGLLGELTNEMGDTWPYVAADPKADMAATGQAVPYRQADKMRKLMSPDVIEAHKDPKVTSYFGGTSTSGDYMGIGPEATQTLEMYREAGKVKEFNKTLTEAAKRFPMVEGLMKEQFQSGPDMEYKIFMDSIRQYPDVSPDKLLQKLRSQGIISLNTVDELMRIGAPKPQSLLA